MISEKGIWAVELYGAFGWEYTGVLILENGRALGGGRHHSTAGEYTLKGRKMAITVTFDYFGEPRTLFGEKHKQFAALFEGKVKKGEITGTVSRPGKNLIPLQFRLTKRVELS